MYDESCRDERLCDAPSCWAIRDFASGSTGSTPLPETETAQPEQRTPAAITGGESADWQQRKWTLCYIVGFVSGAIGILAGHVLATAIGIDSRLPGSAGHAGALQLPVQVASRLRSTGDGIVVQVRNTSALPLRSAVTRMSAPGDDNCLPPSRRDFAGAVNAPTPQEVRYDGKARNARSNDAR